MFWQRFFNPFKNKEKINEEYKVFTRAFDLEVSGLQLTMDLSNADRQSWNKEMEDYEALTGGLKEKFDFFGLGEKHHSEMLPEFDPARTVVTVLIDHSGSLKGLPAMITCLLVECIGEYLSGLGTKFEILGFTTSTWKGGFSMLKWKEHNFPPQPGRLNDILHIVYRSAAATEKGAPFEIRHLLNNVLLKENIDGEAIFWAKARLDEINEPNNFILMISDGAPVDDATLIVNRGNYLHQHLLKTIDEISSDPRFKLAGIGIRHDVSSFYETNLCLENMDDIPTKVPNFLLKTLQ